MRHIRVPRRERIRKSEVVQVVDNTQGPTDPRLAVLYHLEKVKQIIQDSDVFTKGDLTAIKRSIAAIETKVSKDEEE